MLYGEDNTFIEGTFYSYLYQEGPDSYVDSIAENGGTIFFKSQDYQGRAISHEGPSNEHRLIHSTIIFGALRDSIHSKNELMQAYMDYLTANLGIEEWVENSTPNLSVSPNPFRHTTDIRYEITDNSRIELKIYDTAGQLVKNLSARSSAIGHQSSVTWDGTDNSGRRLSSGSYILRIETNEGVIDKLIVLVR